MYSFPSTSNAVNNILIDMMLASIYMNRTMLFNSDNRNRPNSILLKSLKIELIFVLVLSKYALIFERIPWICALDSDWFSLSFSHAFTVFSTNAAYETLVVKNEFTTISISSNVSPNFNEFNIFFNYANEISTVTPSADAFAPAPFLGSFTATGFRVERRAPLAEELACLKVDRQSIFRS